MRQSTIKNNKVGTGKMIRGDGGWNVGVVCWVRLHLTESV